MQKTKVVIVGAGPAGLFAAFKLSKNENFDIQVLEKGLENRKCPSIENKINCINCNICSITEGLGGAGAYSDGKFPITNDFGGALYRYTGKDKAISLMKQVDSYNRFFYENLELDFSFPKIFSSKDSKYKKLCTQNNLHLLDADIRHLGSDIGKIIYKELYKKLLDQRVKFSFQSEVCSVRLNNDNTYTIDYKNQITRNIISIEADIVIVATGRSGSKWVADQLCKDLKIKTSNNRIDIGIRFECPNEVWNHITEELYESKIVYKTKTYEDLVRTFCMNPSGSVVTEKSNNIITVNGHSYEDLSLKTDNTNFALLVSKHFTEPFNDSNEYGEAIARLSNMLSGGALVQRYGDLIRGKRTTKQRLLENTVKPTLNAEPGDLSLVLPKRILDDILEMIEKLNVIAPGMINDDNLLYGTEIKQYNCTVEVDNSLQAKKNLYIIGDCSGVTHSLSQASASGLHVAYSILES